MQAQVTELVRDSDIALEKGGDIIEEYTTEDEDFFLDGPVSRRVAVLDFDPHTGELLPGVPFRTSENGRDGYYELADPGDHDARDFNMVSVFATVLKTLHLFEEADALGRKLQMWAFDAPQLLVVARAGEWPNAYYERESHSLQFFSFTTEKGGQPRTIYTSLVGDIVAHETAHAILDAIAQDLYNALSPQSLALHEAIADLTALLIAFRNDTLRQSVLETTAGSIAKSNGFSAIAEEFAEALHGETGSDKDNAGRNKADSQRHASYLRSLKNEKSLSPAFGELVRRTEPHDLSEVLSGALYEVLVAMHETEKLEIAQRRDISAFSASGEALVNVSRRFKRMILRALDYLPPGEVSFSDYARAIIAADQASHPADSRERDLLRAEFAKRGIVATTDALQVETQVEPKFAEIIKRLDLQTLIDSDWAAYELANQYRTFLRIPEGIHFWVRPRLKVTKRYYHGNGRQSDVTECIFKVSWDHKEANPALDWLPRQRQITVGTTLAIHWSESDEDGQPIPGEQTVRARITSDLNDTQLRDDRNDMVARLLNEGLLLPEYLARTPDGEQLPTTIRAEMLGDQLMRVRGTARMLHIAKEGVHGHA